MVYHHVHQFQSKVENELMCTGGHFMVRGQGLWNGKYAERPKHNFQADFIYLRGCLSACSVPCSIMIIFFFSVIVIMIFHQCTNLLMFLQLNMERVALLHHSARLHFHLQGPSGSKLQIASGEQFEDVDSSGRPCYKVVVAFTGGMFGSFSQWVVFDFGKKPVLLKKINVELGQETVHEKVS